MSLKSRVVKLMKDYVRDKKVAPTKVKLTALDEIELKMAGDEIGKDRNYRLFKGDTTVQEEFPDFLGLEIIWNADETAVE